MIGTAAAQEFWPNKPIRLIVASPAGGPSDIAARIIGDRLWKVLGQAVIIDNRVAVFHQARDREVGGCHQGCGYQ
ncbi:MAG: hypothetical protein FJ122_16280 [Deltaproteobacteria bacterium]|nr:hypothetical protein [Deltaproteobacteria bacterium]